MFTINVYKNSDLREVGTLPQLSVTSFSWREANTLKVRVLDSPYLKCVCPEDKFRACNYFKSS